jgi:hypothetical protein
MPELPLLQATVVTAGDIPSTVTALATTPNSFPNIAITVVRPVVALLVRFGNAFGTQWLGLVAASFTPAGGKLLYTNDFLHMAVLCASLAFPGAAVASAKDLVTIFGKLETKFPLLTGNV